MVTNFLVSFEEVADSDGVDFADVLQSCILKFVCSDRV